MSQHTPRPWMIRDFTDQRTSKEAFTEHYTIEPQRNDGLRTVIARIKDIEMCSEHGGSAFDNARLIAACPDMASYVISKALEGDADAEKIARSFGWIPA